MLTRLKSSQLFRVGSESRADGNSVETHDMLGLP